MDYKDLTDREGVGYTVAMKASLRIVREPVTGQWAMSILIWPFETKPDVYEISDALTELIVRPDTFQIVQ